MAFTLELKTLGENKVLHVNITGPLNTEITAGVVRKVVETGRMDGVNRALIDLRETWLEDSFLDVHAFMEGLQNLGVYLSDQIAVVYKNDPEHHEHAENVAFNRGFSQLRYFKDINMALNWLSQT